MATRTKKAHMSDEVFAELKESLEQALAYERGAREGYRVTRIAVSRPQQTDDLKEVDKVEKDE